MFMGTEVKYQAFKDFVGQGIIITVKSETRIASCYSRMSPCAKSDFVNKVLLAHSHTHLFIAYGCLWPMTAELSIVQ